MASDNCKLCKERDANVSGVIKGQYVDDVCRECFNRLLADQSVSSGWADYMRSRDFEDHQVEAIQPYTRDGKISSDFVRIYPNQAASMFSEQQLRDNL